MLFVFRGLAGVANGGITALSMMIVSDIVTLKERGKWQGILGSCVGAGSMAGPFIAAAFTQPGTWGHTSWRSFFWLVSGLALLAGVVAYFALPTPKNAPPMTFKTVNKEVDWWGILVGSAAIICSHLRGRKLLQMGVANSPIHVDCGRILHGCLHLDREVCRSSTNDTM